MEINDMKTHSIYDLQLERDTFTTIVSKRKSGKSVTISNLIYYFMELAKPENRCDFAYLFSKTAASNRETNHSLKFFDARAILQPTQENIATFLERLFKSQDQTGFKYHVLLVFDDINVGERYPALEELATMGRHKAITVILSSQISNNAISPIIRGNIDYIFWRKLGAMALKNNVFPYMDISEFSKYDQLHDFTLKNTGDYTFIWYNNNTDVVEGKIKLTRAEDLPESYQYVVEAPIPTPRRTRPPIRRW